MKKVMKLVLGMMILGTVLVSCKTNVDSHDHTYSEEWTSDGTHHWHEATCEHTDEVVDKAEHTFGEGEITENLHVKLKVKRLLNVQSVLLQRPKKLLLQVIPGMSVK